MRRTKKAAGETRTSILDAAESIFHRQGVAQTSLGEVAAAAQVTRGAIYWHFSDKTALLKAMSDRASLPEEEFFKRHASGDCGETLQGLKTLVMEMVRRFASDTRMQQVYEIIFFRCEHIGEMSGVTNRRREVEAEMRHTLLSVFRRAGGNSQLGPGWTPEIAAASLHCSISGVLSEWMRLDRSFDVVEVTAALLDGLLGGFERERPRRVSDAAEASSREPGKTSYKERCAGLGLDKQRESADR